MERPGAIVGSDELLESVWGFHPGTATPAVVRVQAATSVARWPSLERRGCWRHCLTGGTGFFGRKAP